VAYLLQMTVAKELPVKRRAATTGEQQWSQDKWQVAAVDGVGFWPAPKNRKN
jgi:hypothetical protein